MTQGFYHWKPETLFYRYRYNKPRILQWQRWSSIIKAVQQKKTKLMADTKKRETLLMFPV